MAKKHQKNAPKDQFPERLRQLRVVKKMSQEDLGKLTDLNYNHIGRYERGDSRPSADKLKALADALGVSTDYLINGDTQNAARVNLEDRDLLEMFRQVQAFPEKQKEALKEVIDAMIIKTKVQAMKAS